MTAASVAGAGCASASFLAHKAATTLPDKGTSLTRIMQPWSTMRSVEGRIRAALSQSRRGGANDLAASMAALDAGIEERMRQPGLVGNGKAGRAWRPVPLDEAAHHPRGTQDARLQRAARQALRSVDAQLYV
jgi:hypothetical protein